MVSWYEDKFPMHYWPIPFPMVSNVKLGVFCVVCLNKLLNKHDDALKLMWCDWNVTGCFRLIHLFQIMLAALNIWLYMLMYFLCESSKKGHLVWSNLMKCGHGKMDMRKFVLHVFHMSLFTAILYHIYIANGWVIISFKNELLPVFHNVFI